MVDERDFWILSQLRKDPFLSYESLGRGIGLSGNAAKSRVEALESEGILTFHGMPAAQVLHRFPRLFFFKRPVTSEKLHAAIEVDPVVFATSDVNRKAAALIYGLSRRPRPPEELVALLGPVESEATPMLPYPRTVFSKPVSLAELKVLRILMERLRVPLKDISDSTGLSQKIVKRARRQLVESGLLQVQPIFQSARSSRAILYEVHVHSDDGSVLSRIRQTLPRSLFLNQWESGAIVMSCLANSMAEVSEAERRVAGEPGVTKVLVKFHARAILSSSRLISWIDGEILRLR